MSVRSFLRRFTGRYRYRVVAGLLAVSLPITVVLAVLLTNKASNSLTATSSTGAARVARTVALHLEDFLSERHENLVTIATQASGRLNDPSVTALAQRIDKIYADYDVVEVVDLAGRVAAASKPDRAYDPSAEPWFRVVASGQPVTVSPEEVGGDIRWVIADPVLDGGGHPIGAVIANLDEAVLHDLLNPELDQSADVIAVDKDRHLVYDTSLGRIDGPALLAKGILRTTVDNAAVTGALAGKSGVARYRDAGRDVVAGYDAVSELDWALVVRQRASVVLAPVGSQRRLAAGVVVAAALVAAGLALLFARREARFLVGVADLSTAASTEVNSAAAELSASAEELAATTTEQSAAVTETSATTEELARASASIADTVDLVAAQAGETRDSLEQAESDIQLSSERTLALAERVNDIGAILGLINEIADQTNLLALNAAIEAARAGEEGRGFAVVAEEVRRLAERSKSSAGEIASIVEAVQTETNATVMAMEKGAKQMQRGLGLLEQVTDATAQVGLTTQQQRSATTQVVETMEQLTDASRQVSATAVQIAAAAATLAALASNLEATADAAKARY